MKKIKVAHSGGSYNIYVGENIISDALGEALSEREYDRVFLVSDSNVHAYWGEHVKSELEKCGRTLAGEHIFKAGELSKRLQTVADMYAAFAGASLTRKSLVIALGGGVCGDMAGFAAATYLRGIAVLQMPTTLLSQIDSSIGGKTGVDLAVGKNLVGAFHQPVAVIADSRFLDTLPKRYIDDGMGEAIKYGCIADKALFDGIANNSIDRAEMIYRCMKIKAEVVEADEFEQNIRAILNYGHTLGHAVEKLGGFERFSHGESVGIGMLYAARIGAAMGYDGTYEAKIREVLEKHSLPTVMDYPADELMAVVCSDKKRTADEIKFILLEELGKAVIVKIQLTRLARILEK
ncbi:MAG: 3-dehydroquinate synthase [Clostridia bacterium]|nr:3-dehydroquinate synthase [Clostridia bacterium]